MNYQALIVTGGLVLITITAMFTNNKDIAIGGLAALAGWLGGNNNGAKTTKTPSG